MKNPFPSALGKPPRANLKNPRPGNPNTQHSSKEWTRDPDVIDLCCRDGQAGPPPKGCDVASSFQTKHKAKAVQKRATQASLDCSRLFSRSTFRAGIRPLATKTDVMLASYASKFRAEVGEAGGSGLLDLETEILSTEVSPCHYAFMLMGSQTCAEFLRNLHAHVSRMKEKTLLTT